MIEHFLRFSIFWVCGAGHMGDQIKLYLILIGKVRFENAFLRNKVLTVV